MMINNRNAPADQLPGKLFVFEGSDEVGKSSLSEMVADSLRTASCDVLLLSFPGREPKTLGKLVYDVHHKINSIDIECIAPTSLQLLHIAAHIDCIENRILPALKAGEMVILDRYWWSTFAYGMASDIPTAVLRALVELEKNAWGNVSPSKLFLITRDAPFRAELSKRQWSRVKDAYMTLMLEEKSIYPIEVIENSKPKEIMVDIILSHIRNTYFRKARILKSEQPSLAFPQQDTQICLTVKSHWLPTKTTKVFDTYWRFAAERQEIFFKRLNGEKVPWTTDQILTNYKFTNAYRASDRVSQYLIRHVIYDGEQSPAEVFFKILLFKTFNKIETWQLLTSELGCVSWREYDFRAYDRILTKAQKEKRSIYSAAYIMPSGTGSFNYQIKHRNHLHLIEKMMKDDLPAQVCDSKSMQEVYDLLRSYPMIGDFLAYQYATDINYSTLTNFSEMSFVVPGPGAKEGICKCFSDFGSLNEVDLIKLMADHQEEEFTRLGIEFKYLWGRILQLVDCQNLFCEVAKYSRIAHPDVKGITGRSRIKQKFKITLEPIEYFYPPKWNINDSVRNTFDNRLFKNGRSNGMA